MSRLVERGRVRTEFAVAPVSRVHWHRSEKNVDRSRTQWPTVAGFRPGINPCLPGVSFPGIAGPLPPGDYRARVVFRLSDMHNDGLGLSIGNFMGPGDFRWGYFRFVVQ